MEKIIIPSFTKLVIKAPKDQKLMQAAQSLEASFLSEMLKAAKLGETSSKFGGGIGEDQLQSFLRNERAKMIAEHRHGPVKMGRLMCLNRYRIGHQ